MKAPYLRVCARRPAPHPGLVSVDETLVDTMMRLDRLPTQLKARIRTLIASADVCHQDRLRTQRPRKVTKDGAR